jgi:hypothetical protein
VRLIHDTTGAEYAGDAPRSGLGPLRGKGQGFFAHLTLAVSADEDRRPLGVLALSTWTRETKPARDKSKPRPRRSVSGGRTDGESLRWGRQAIESEERLVPGTKCVHVMDREGDSYALMSRLMSSGFVIRATHNRVVELPEESRVDEPNRLKAIMASARVVLRRDVQLGRRRSSRMPVERKIHPPRETRQATLAVAVQTVQIRRSEYVSRDLPQTLSINVVRVFEVDAPAGAEPIEWLLLTNLPIDTPEQVAAVVDHYRARWQIEELNKALKSGCNIEKRQLESLDALLNALAMFVPIAWRMLLLRNLAHHAPEAPAALALTPTQIDVLCTTPELKLGPRPTLRRALYAIAQLGGHIARNGPPGWQTLARGFQDLALMEKVWIAASRQRNNDAIND